jgi:hypothetical protein
MEVRAAVVPVPPDDPRPIRDGMEYTVQKTGRVWIQSSTESTRVQVKRGWLSHRFTAERIAEKDEPRRTGVSVGARALGRRDDPRRRVLHHYS